MHPRETVPVVREERISAGGGFDGLRRHGLRATGLVTLVAAATAAPLFMRDSADLFLLAYTSLIVLLAVQLHLLLGMSGIFSLGQAAFFGVGAYSGVLLMDRGGLDGAVALPLVAVIGASVGVLVAVTTLRSSDLYLALITLAFGFIGENVVRNLDVTGRAQGLAGFELSLFGASLTDPRLIYWVALTAILLFVAVIVSLRRSRLGRGLMAVRESPIGAQSIGINPRSYRVFAFALAGAFAAIAGALYVAFAFVVDPSVFGLGLTIQVLTICIVGGLRSLPGVVVSAVLLTYLRNSVEGMAVQEYLLLSYGALVVLVLLFVPEGLGGGIRLVTRAFGARASRPLAAGGGASEGSGSA